VTDPPRPERDLDPAALDELSRAFADHQRDRTPVESPVDPPIDPLIDAAGVDDDLEPTAPTPAVFAEAELSLADLVTSVDAPNYESHEPTPQALGERQVVDVSDDGADEAGTADPAPLDVPAGRPIIKIGDADHVESTDEMPARTPAGIPDGPRVIAIDDADLPDAVYVQGSLDSARNHGVIIIEDDGSGDVLRPESERDLRRGIEPRMRERRLAVKRARGRKRLMWVGVACGVVLVLVAALAIVGSGWFAVEEDQVTVTGNVYTDPAALQAVIDDLVGTPVLRVDTEAAEDQLRSIAWVEDARVHVAFPHSATIEIREREALTTYQGPDGRFRVLDRQGRVLDVLDMYPLAYVLISGPDSVDLDIGEFAPQGYAAASELAKSLTVSVRGRVDHLSVIADGSDLTLVMNNGMQVRFGEARELITKLVRLETVLAEMRREAIEAGEDPENLGGPDIVINVSTSETTR
jgi:cell division protein FtsQ